MKRTITTSSLIAFIAVSCSSCSSEPLGPILVAPFEQADVVAVQKAWSESLGTPAELTNSIGMRFALIPPGEFVMGSPESEDGRDIEEHQHEVRITKPFYLGVYEVTQTDYQRVMKETPGYFTPTGRYSDIVANLDTSRFPVELVTWHDAVSFCLALSSLPQEEAAGRVYDLPTEAQWEYACRAGTTTPFHFGNQSNGIEANVEGDDPYGTADEGPYLDRPISVGSYPPNGFGLHDMHGNVQEWCRDWYGWQYYESSPSMDPEGGNKSRYRVVRGGGWADEPSSCRSALRFELAPDRHTINTGFRVIILVP